jgi:pimeloyl-ACP methyl ester carboxylesterase
MGNHVRASAAASYEIDSPGSADPMKNALAAVFPALVALFEIQCTRVDSHFVDLDGAKIHYTKYGHGDTAFFFVQGWSCDETVWRGQARALADLMCVITIDLPGHGHSDKPQIAYAMNLYARAIDAVLHDAYVHSAVLVGHSNGVPVVREFYREFPEKVRALVIVEGGVRPFFDAATMAKFIEPLRGDHYEEAAGRFIGGITQPIKDEKLRDEIKILMLRTPQHVSVSEMEVTLDPTLWRPDKIDVPVLMILAKQPVWTAEYERFARSLVPNLGYQVWENVSHFLMMESRMSSTRRWLASCEKTRFCQTARNRDESRLEWARDGRCESRSVDRESTRGRADFAG